MLKKEKASAGAGAGAGAGAKKTKGKNGKKGSRERAVAERDRTYFWLLPYSRGDTAPTRPLCSPNGSVRFTPGRHRFRGSDRGPAV